MRGVLTHLLALRLSYIYVGENKGVFIMFFYTIFLRACIVATLLVSSFVYGVPKPSSSEPIQAISAPKGLSASKVELGKKLFFEPRLSKSGFISCNSCHNVMLSGTDNMPVSIGHKWQLGPINSPTVFNSSYNFVQFWNGRAKDLEEQAGGPIEADKEMASSHTAAVAVIKSIPGYVSEFKKVYGAKPIVIKMIQNAIAEFEKSLVTTGSRFDKWLAGDTKAITQTEYDGYQLFKTKGCTSCHMGAAVGGTMYQKLGLVKEYKYDKKNMGRYEVTKKASDKRMFKVPILRNIELTYPYFHDGAVWDLKEAVEIMAEIQLGLKVNPKERDAIVAFLKTLTGEIPKLTMPILYPSTSKTAKPSTL